MHLCIYFSFLGYAELNDLAVEYLCCGDGSSSFGLTQLTDLTLPENSHVTTEGLMTILNQLQQLEKLKHSGNLGLVFSSEDFKPDRKLVLKDFEQTRSMCPSENELASWLGMITIVTFWYSWFDSTFEHPSHVTYTYTSKPNTRCSPNGFWQERLEHTQSIKQKKWSYLAAGLRPWTPSFDSVMKLFQTCPKLDTMRLLLQDSDFKVLAEALVSHPGIACSPRRYLLEERCP